MKPTMLRYRKRQTPLRAALADKSETMNRTPPVSNQHQTIKRTPRVITQTKKKSPLVDALENAETETEEEQEEQEEILTYDTFFKVAKIDLASRKTPWSVRVERLKRLAELFETENGNVGDIDVLIPGLIVQLKENRSAVVREVSLTIERLANILKQKFASVAMRLMPVMLKSAASSNKVIASHVRKSVNSVLSNMILSNFHHVATDAMKRNRGPRMATNCGIFVERTTSEWSNEDIEVQMKDVTEALKKLLCHGSADARSHAQQALRSFHLRWPDECKVFLKTLPYSNQKQCRVALGMASVSRSASRREEFRRMRKSSTRKSRTKSNDLRRHMLRSRYGSSVEPKKQQDSPYSCSSTFSSSSSSSSSCRRSARRAMRKLRRGHANGARRSLAMCSASKSSNKENVLTMKAACVVANLIDTCDVALDSSISSSSSSTPLKSSSISMTPLIESMRAFHISSIDTPTDCGMKSFNKDDKILTTTVEKMLFTIPEKSVVMEKPTKQQIVMSTPPPPPSPPSHSLSDEERMKEEILCHQKKSEERHQYVDEKIDAVVVSHQKKTEQSHQKTGPRFENGKWIWDDEDEQDTIIDPTSQPPPMSFQRSSEPIKTLHGLDVLLQPPKAKFLMGRERRMLNVAAVPQQQPPKPTTTHNKVKHQEYESVEHVKRESVGSRTMAFAATAMFGVAAMGSFWTHYCSTTDTVFSVEKTITLPPLKFCLLEEEPKFCLLEDEPIESQLTKICVMETTHDLVVYTPPPSYPYLFENDVTISFKTQGNEFETAEETTKMIEYSDKMLWRPLPSPFEALRPLVSKRHDFENKLSIFDELRSIHVNLKQQQQQQRKVQYTISIEETQNRTIAGDIIVHFRDGKITSRHNGLVDKLDLRFLPKTPPSKNNDAMVQKIMRGQSIIRRALVDSVHLETEVSKYRNTVLKTLAYKNELAKMRAAREEKERKERERIRRKLKNFEQVMLLSSSSSVQDVSSSFSSSSFAQDTSFSASSAQDTTVKTTQQFGFSMNDIVMGLVSAMMGWGFMALSIHMSVWFKTNEVLDEDEIESMEECEELVQEHVVSHRQTFPVVLPGIHIIPSQQGRYNLRPRTPINYSERRRSRRRHPSQVVDEEQEEQVVVAEETPQHAMSHITLPLSAFGRLEQNTMMINNDNHHPHHHHITTPTRVPPQTARPRAKRRLEETVTTEKTPQPRRSARLAKRRRRVLCMQTPLMFSQQTPSSSSSIPTPLPFSVNTPRV